MRAPFAAFAQAPSRSTFLAAYRSLGSRARETVTAADFTELVALREAGDHEGLRKALNELPPLSALSPAVHRLAAEAAIEAHDIEDAQLEQFLLETCLTAILDTGDGSAQAPYFVVASLDERLVCQELGLSPRSQELVNAAGLLLDVIECACGRKICFQVAHLAPLAEKDALRRRRSKTSAIAAKGRSTSAVRRSARRLTQTGR